jgi:membrane protein implicated in regulation of membrane protease activity
VTDWQLWLLAAFGLMIAEMIAPGFWLMSVAVGCFAAAVAGFLPFDLSVQVMTFAGGTVASLALLRPLLVRRFHHGGVRTNMDALIGKTAIVTQRLGPQGQTGRLLVEGEDWRALSVDDAAVEPGTRVIVVEVDGATLKVEREAMP